MDVTFIPSDYQARVGYAAFRYLIDRGLLRGGDIDGANEAAEAEVKRHERLLEAEFSHAEVKPPKVEVDF